METSKLSYKEQRIAKLAVLAMDCGLSLSIDYDGIERIIEPHAIGINKAGRPCMRAYQTNGDSLSGQNEGWKLFNMEKIFTFPKIIDIQGSYPREGYKPGDLGMTTILKEF